MDNSNQYIHSKHSGACLWTSLLPRQSVCSRDEAIHSLPRFASLFPVVRWANVSGIISSRPSTQHRVMPRTRNRGPCKACQAAKRKVRRSRYVTQGIFSSALTDSKPSVIRRNPSARAAANRIYLLSPLFRPGGGSAPSIIRLITRHLRHRRPVRRYARQQRRH